MTITLYGLKNCDACRKARRELEAAGIAHGYVDVRADGVERERLEAWAGTAGWRALLNTRSTTWRDLPERQRGDVDEAGAIALMAEHPTLIKRPVIEDGNSVLVGWTPETRNAMGLRP